MSNIFNVKDKFRHKNNPNYKIEILSFKKYLSYEYNIIIRNHDYKDYIGLCLNINELGLSTNFIKINKVIMPDE